MNLIEYNKKFQSTGCPKCGAWQGDPCRTPKRAKVTQPHRERVEIVKALDTVERALGAVDRNSHG